MGAGSFSLVGGWGLGGGWGCVFWFVGFGGVGGGLGVLLGGVGGWGGVFAISVPSLYGIPETVVSLIIFSFFFVQRKVFLFKE